ncbi:DUF4373 domain-containing protein [Cytobacillus oceanisediminis]|uniref:DUF4373 domain-containing protein n=1 Tax=Cytobacillus oceanisediminis TaxID=665099 RepID=UPI001C246D73|nr:DUF4373 domain-containing protein [Cytobacillus oceanisediminis]MBU8770302.1 DUF4373 domain-containing protein [Cytobacillus oceanisediminis]
MARPKKEGMDYFPHDTDAVNDEKIESLRLLYGNDGYAFYFILLERIYRTKQFELDVSDAETIQILAKKVSVSEDKFLKMLETSLKRDCFDRQAYEERKVLTSEGIKKRASVVVDKRVKMRDKYQQTKEEVSDAETTQETGVESTQSKVKKSKEKKSKNKYAEYVSMSLEEFEKLKEQFGGQGANDRIEKLNLYKGSTGKTYKSDYLTILNWERKNSKKETSKQIDWEGL